MKTEEIFEMTFWKHLAYIWISMSFFLIAPGTYLFSVIVGGNNGSLLLIAIIWIVAGLFYIVGFKLHLSYYRNDKGRKIVFNENSNIIIRNISGNYSFRKEDIESITNHQSGLNNQTPWNDYEFSVFKLKNGDEVIITCLLLDFDTIIKRFPDTFLIRKKHFIASLDHK